MKLSLALSILLASPITSALGATDVASAVHHPHKVSYATLIEDEGDTSTRRTRLSSSLLVDALTEHGIVSITGVPGYASSRKTALAHLHVCLLDARGQGKEAKEHTFADGTVRMTLATHTVPGPGGQQPIFKQKEQTSSPSSEACASFEKASDSLRASVATATEAFADALGSLLDVEGENKRPLLSTRGGEYDFDTWSDAVESGEHLEHFHSYTKGSSKDNNDEAGSGIDTIELHTDQGIFIAFAPALTVRGNGAETLSNEFFIELKDSTRARVHFDDDDLIFMLGDGVNQVLSKSEGNGGNRALRATPHGLHMAESNDAYSSRVWYGRMVLPPVDAVHPEHGKTFGHLRQLMIDASLSDKTAGKREALSLGCSGHGVEARQLEESVCALGSTFCWHRCMAHSDHNVSTEICAATNLQLQCINPRGQVYVSGHGDFYPACSNSTENVTDYPTVPEYPRDITVCDMDAWKEFATSEGYVHVFDKLGDNRGNRGWWDGANEKGGGNVTRFMWNVVDDDTVQGKLVFNGLFGYLAVGFSNSSDSRKNGMSGANVIMAIPGGNYTAFGGLDLDMGPSVEEYIIHPVSSAFRHWSDPIPGRDTTTYNVETSDCFTALTFRTDNINDNKFNVSGTDDLVWAGNLKDRFCGWHGRGDQDGPGDRDRYVVEWKTGKAWLWGEWEEMMTKNEEEPKEDMTGEVKAASSSSSTVAPARDLAALMVVMMGLLGAMSNV